MQLCCPPKPSGPFRGKLPPWLWRRLTRQDNEEDVGDFILARAEPALTVASAPFEAPSAVPAMPYATVIDLTRLPADSNLNLQSTAYDRKQVDSSGEVYSAGALGDPAPFMVRIR